jgi:tetratricopeptide (TPR) repeat protein
LEIEPQNAIAYFHRGSAYYLSGKNNQAIEDLTEAIRLDPANADAYNNRGGAYRNIGEYNRAIADYTEGLRLAPNDAIIKNNLADVRNRQARAQITSSLNITSMKVGNWSTESNGWITRPGERLTSAEIRYLMPDITVDSLTSGEMTFFVKIIDPWGGIFRNQETSPAGYTYSYTVQVSRKNNQNIDLLGWGKSDESIYFAGEWTVEVWYNGVCLRSEKVRIN